MSDDIEVVGGSHGVVAQTDEMLDRAAALRAAAEALAEADGAVRALRRRIARAALATGGAVASGARAEGALDALGGIRGLAATSDDVARAGTNLVAAANEYLEAETRAREGLVGLARTFGVEVGERPWTWPALFAVVRTVLEPHNLLTAGVAGWRAGHPPHLPDGRQVDALVRGISTFVAVGLPGRTPHGDPVAAAALGLADFTGPGPLTRRDLAAPSADVTVAMVGVRSAGEPVTDPASALRLVASQTPAEGAQAGQVAIQRLEHADGSRSWVVAIPGTEGWGGVYSWNSDFALASGGASAAAAVVAQAMKQAGIAPGEPVVLAGHSQGGMIAARIATDPVLQRQFTMRALVTAGSPIAPAALPESLQTLSLEHREDGIPGLDGMRSPDTPTRVTVEADSPRGGSVVWPWEYGDPHELGGYITTAESLPTDEGSLIDFQAELSAALGDDVVSATTLEFQGVVVDDGARHE